MGRESDLDNQTSFHWWSVARRNCRRSLETRTEHRHELHLMVRFVYTILCNSSTTWRSHWNMLKWCTTLSRKPSLEVAPSILSIRFPTVTTNFDLWPWPRYCQDQPAWCQISRSQMPDLMWTVKTIYNWMVACCGFNRSKFKIILKIIQYYTPATLPVMKILQPTTRFCQMTDYCCRHQQHNNAIHVKSNQNLMTAIKNICYWYAEYHRKCNSS